MARKKEERGAGGETDIVGEREGLWKRQKGAWGGGGERETGCHAAHLQASALFWGKAPVLAITSCINSCGSFRFESHLGFPVPVPL